MQHAAGRARKLDAASAGVATRRVEGRRHRLVRDGAPGSQKNKLKPWLTRRFCIPPKENGPFVAAMEHVLDIYQSPYDPARPVVCVDETSKQLVEHTRVPLPVQPGSVACVDDEYVRGGVANIFMAVEPMTGTCVTKVTEHRACVDFAHFMRELCDVQYPNAKSIVVVLDNLSTHSTGALYAAFEPAEAHRIANKIEFHFTPKHGSWLNMAEIELSLLSRQCLDRRIATLQQLAKEIAAWTVRHNTDPAPIRWRFTTADARIKLLRLYPSRAG